MAKSHKLPFQSNEQKAVAPLDIIHCDLWGPSPVNSKDNYRYYVIFVDDFSRFTWFYPLKLKTDFYTTLPNFINLVQTQFSRKIKIFQSDGGTEFVNQHVRQIFHNNGTFHRFSCPYTPQQNGRAERKHRHIVETGLAMMFHGHVPLPYWVDAFSTVVHIINRLPSTLLNNKSPFETLLHQRPQYDNFRVFACRVYPYVRDVAIHKLAPRSIPCIFLGYCLQHKGYKCLDPITNRVFITRHARFDESHLPFSSTPGTSDLSTLPLHTFLDTINLPTTPQSPSSIYNTNLTPPQPTRTPSQSPCTCHLDSTTPSGTIPTPTVTPSSTNTTAETTTTTPVPHTTS